MNQTRFVSKVRWIALRGALLGLTGLYSLLQVAGLVNRGWREVGRDPADAAGANEGAVGDPVALDEEPGAGRKTPPAERRLSRESVAA